MLPSDKRVAIVACRQRKQRTTKEQTKPGRRIGHWTRDKGQGTRDGMQNARGGLALDPSDIQSVRPPVCLAGELPAFAYVSCDFWRLYDFSGLYTKSCLQFLFSLVCFCFAFCFCCCCHLRNVQRNGATADTLHKNKSPLSHTNSENRNNDVAHVPSCSRLEWVCPCHCPLSLILSLFLSHSSSAYGQCSIQSPGDLRAIQQFYEFTIFMQRSTI